LLFLDIEINLLDKWLYDYCCNTALTTMRLSFFM